LQHMEERDGLHLEIRENEMAYIQKWEKMDGTT
jgi:hypothetical protein